MKSVTVYWFDSAIGPSDGEFPQADIDTLAPINMVSVGILARETDALIVLAKDYNTTTQCFRGWSLIPKVNITKIIRHEVGTCQ